MWPYEKGLELLIFEGQLKKKWSIGWLQLLSHFHGMFSIRLLPQDRLKRTLFWHGVNKFMSRINIGDKKNVVSYYQDKILKYEFIEMLGFSI